MAVGHARHPAAVLLVALMPVLLVLAALAGFFGVSPERLVPYVGDEVAFWNQVAAFEQAGMNGGYVTVNEQPSRAAFSHFGPHGPAYPVLYGSAARLVGWEPPSAPLFSAVLVSAAIAWWVTASGVPLLPAALFFGTFWPLLIALPNTMHESLHFAFAAALAALVAAVLREKAPGRAWSGVLLVLVLATASLVRPMWALLAMPLGALVWLTRGRRVWVGFAAGFLFTAGLFVAFMWLAAPYPSGGAGFVFDLPRDPGGTIGRMLRLAAGQHLPAWLNWGAEPLEILFRYELMALGLLAFVLAVRAPRPWPAARLVVVGASALLLTLAVVAVGTIGSWQDYRTVTPVLLFLWLVAASVYPTTLWIAIGVHAAAAPIAIATFISFQEPRFDEDRLQAIADFRTAVEGVVRFDASLPPWGNSVLIDAENYQTPLLGLPKGIGVSAVLYWEQVALPPRSRYLILREQDLRALGSGVRLRRIGDTSLGALFENLEWRR